MAKPTHFRVTYSGTIGAPAAPLEEWSFSLNCSGGGYVPAEPEDLQVTADSLFTAINQNVMPVLPSHVWLNRTRIAHHSGPTAAVTRNNEGQYLQADNLVSVAGAVASSSGNRMPLQTALCVSLDTERAGARGRGRFFLPWPGFTIGTDHRLSQADQNTMVDAARDLLNAINLIGLPGETNLQVVVASTYGFATTVNQVRVGRVPDTMRSRRRDLIEEHVALPVVFA